jgi:hypothetical protein
MPLRPHAVVDAPICQAGAEVFPALEQKRLTILERNMQIMEAVGTPFTSPAEPPESISRQ